MFQRASKLASTSRFTLQKPEVLRLPSHCREVQVLSGVAWLTIDQKDIVLRPGEKAKLPFNPNSAVISVLGKAPVILDIVGLEMKVRTQQQTVNLPC